MNSPLEFAEKYRERMAWNSHTMLGTVPGRIRDMGEITPETVDA
jgi:hypothetical protein